MGRPGPRSGSVRGTARRRAGEINDRPRQNPAYRPAFAPLRIILPTPPLTPLSKCVARPTRPCSWFFLTEALHTVRASAPCHVFVRSRITRLCKRARSRAERECGISGRILLLFHCASLFKSNTCHDGPAHAGRHLRKWLDRRAQRHRDLRHDALPTAQDLSLIHI